MSTYKLKLYEYQKIRNTYEFEFETGDQAAWDKLLDLAATFGDVRPEDDPLCDIPKSAPADPSKWFELCQLIYEAAAPFKRTKATELLPTQDGEIDIEMDYLLEDAKGNIVMQETHGDLL